MVRRKPDQEVDSGFFVDDEDEDMDTLMRQAEAAGSAATDELDAPSNVFGEDEAPASAPTPEPEPVRAPEPTPEAVFSSDTGDDIDRMLADLEAGRTPTVETPIQEAQPEPEPEPASEPVYTPEPEPVREPEPVYRAEPVYIPPAEPVRQPDPEPVYVAPTPEPVYTPPVQQQPIPAAVQEPTTPLQSNRLAPKPRSFSVEEQIQLAQRIVETVDVYRGLSKDAKDVVAQLLAPTTEEYTQEEGAVAIRAIYADSIQQATQRALIEAKQADPVERVFYVLALPKDVLKYLGELVEAYSGTALPSGAGDLQFARSLVDAIDKLTNEPIVYAEAMDKVLKAAQG